MYVSVQDLACMYASIQARCCYGEERESCPFTAKWRVSKTLASFFDLVCALEERKMGKRRNASKTDTL